MSRALFSRSPDLKRLRDEGYFVQIAGGHLIMREVPYVDANRKVRTGTLVSVLDTAGDITTKPGSHVVFFDGDSPCGADGKPIKGVGYHPVRHSYSAGATALLQLSSKPGPQGYANYFDKMSTYATLLAGPAAVLDTGATPRVYREFSDPEDDSVFNYVETASDRVGIGATTQKLETECVAIIGLGGTGGYILDLVAKTPVREIRLFDADEFLTHNAFRAPGAPSLEELREAPRKVDYFERIYSRMHRGVKAFAEALTEKNIDLLNGVTIAFISMDSGPAKRAIVDKLNDLHVPFIDVGMGLELTKNGITGILRVTTGTPEKADHISGRISFEGGGDDDIYATNIQVADLNAFNAILAVIKWKKLCGFYADLEREHNSTYTVDGNLLVNGDEQ